MSAKPFLLSLGAAWLTLALCGCIVAANDPIDPQADVRLAKRSTFFFPPAPLGDVLQKISQQTGVSLRAERSVAQHRAILVVHDKPLHETLNKLAEAFGYTWRKIEKKGTPPEYMLSPPAQVIAQQQAEVQSLRQTALRLLRESVREWSQRQITELNAVREQMNAVAMQAIQTYRETQKPLGERETLRLLRLATQQRLTESWATWTVACMLARFTAQQWNALERGEVFVLETGRADAQLPPEVLHLFRSEHEAVLERQLKMFSSEEAERFRHEQMERYRAADRVLLQFALHPVSGRLYYSTAVFADNQVLSDGGKVVTPHLWEVVCALHDFPAGGDSLPPYDEGLVKKLSAKPPRAVPLEPSAAMDVTGNVLALYARENGVDLVAEWYPYLPREEGDAGEARTETIPVVGMGEGMRISAPSRDLEAGEVTFGSVKILATALDWRTVQKNLRQNRYLLHDSERWVVVTQQLRALCRHYEIPESSIREWFLQPGRQGVPAVNDLVDIAALLPEQIERVEIKRQNLRQANRDFTTLTSLAHNPTLQAVLLALRSASPAQRESAWKGTPIPFPLLTPQAQRYLLYAIRWATGVPVQGSPAQWSFAVRSEQRVQEEPDMSRFSEDLLRSLRHESPEEWLQRQPESVRRQLARTQITQYVRFMLITPQGEYELAALSFHQ
ncbi:MAG: hypothetical protein KatS3mg022_0066 [Armatimonadota bacterium]|nr:MAG: hypothetical protein KatS3mg022_0066 [Armatimonadota bacterium]